VEVSTTLRVWIEYWDGWAKRLYLQYDLPKRDSSHQWQFGKLLDLATRWQITLIWQLRFANYIDLATSLANYIDLATSLANRE
jgi:hypothetical protein